MTEATTPEPQLNRAGRRAETRRLRKTGAVMAAIPAAFGTTALLLGATAATVGAASTLTVNSLGDAGDGTCDVSPGECTLRDALDDAADGDTIVFETGLTGTITLNGNDLVVDYAVDIQGPGASDITIDAQYNDNIFYVNLVGSGKAVTISGLTLVHGDDNFGGAIEANGSDDVDLTVTNAVFEDNVAYYAGGAIFSDSGTVTISGSTFTGNDAGPDYDGDGGAVAVAGVDSLSITDSIFTDNTAWDDGGAVYAYDVGGAVTITGSTFTDNEADYDDGGAVAVNSSNAVSITDSTFTRNDADDSGGALYLYDLSGAATITGSTFTENVAVDNDAGAVYFGEILGGATVTGSTFTDNDAYDNGGAIVLYETPSLDVTDSTFTGNYAGGDGGAIYVADDSSTPVATVTITRSTFTDNTADDDGGAITLDDFVSVTVTDSTFTENTAAEDGGALYIEDFDGTVSITGSTFTANAAGYDGGALAVDDVASFSLATSTVSGNAAGRWGGGLYLGGVDTSATVNASTISGNTADDGGGIFVAYVYGGVTLFNSTVSGNTAGSEGGGIALLMNYVYQEEETAASALTLVQTTVTANVATTIGGIAFVDDDRERAVEQQEEAPTDDASDKGAGDRGQTRTLPATEADDEARVGSAALQGPDTVTLDGTIVSLNSGVDIGDRGTLVTTGSLVGTISGTTLTDQGGNLFGVDPKLGPLQDNGGPTQTHALLDGSPAINAGPDPVADFPGNTDDQRGPGYPRVVGGRVDIGAFEVQPTNIEPTFTG